MKTRYDIVVIGGSSGSIPVLMELFKALPQQHTLPVVVVVHRMKNVTSELRNLLSGHSNIYEPDDKEPILPGKIYLAPQNYHLLVEDDKTFSLDYSEPVNYSRPSIDVTFNCMADVYGPRTAAVLLSGANSDGAAGLSRIVAAGGLGLVQDPGDSEYPIMPAAAIKLAPNATIKDKAALIKTLLTI